MARTLAAGVTFEGLVLPSGATRVASDARGTDFRTADASDDVVSFIAAQLIEATHSTPARGVARFERATPKSQDPNALQLYILVMPEPQGGTSIRVLRTPVDASPEAAAARIEQFQRDLPTLD